MPLYKNETRTVYANYGQAMPHVLIPHESHVSSFHSIFFLILNRDVDVSIPTRLRDIHSILIVIMFRAFLFGLLADSGVYRVNKEVETKCL